MRNSLTKFTRLHVMFALLSVPFAARSQGTLDEPSPFNILSSDSNRKFAAGEWGDLEFYPIVLEPSDFFFSSSLDLLHGNAQTVWRLAAKDSAEVEKILTASGISSQLAQKLVGPQFLSKNEALNLMEVAPPEEVILGLTQAQRSRLYPQLMPKDSRSPYFKPFTLPFGGIDAVSHIATGLPADQIERIRKVSYNVGGTTKLSDIEFLMHKAADYGERFRLIKTLAREISYTAQLKLYPGTDVDRLAAYWESGGKNKDVRPILESVVRTSGIDHLDIVHLLPPTPRKLLHTYPSPVGEGLADDLPDCFWTSFAFFADTPPDRHLDFVGHVFSERYEVAEMPLQFGDLILFRKDDPTKWIHACNHIAGDFVFTKNGMSMGRPWAISPLKDIADRYLTDEGMHISFFRLKPEYQR